MVRKAKKNNDISNKAVSVMLVIFILTSVVSLGIYLEALDTAEPTVIQQTSGKVYLEVRGNPEPSYSTTEGNVMLEVKS